MAYERGDPEVSARIRRALESKVAPRTHGGVVGQVFRSGRQARLSALLRGTEVVPLDRDLGRRTGMLLARAATADVIDAALVLVAIDGDEILTSDAADIVRLAQTSKLHLKITPV